MPESHGGRDGQEERRDRGNIVSVISEFVDDNLTFVRVGSALSPVTSCWDEGGGGMSQF